MANAVEIRVTDNWINLIRFCATEFPYGDLGVRIVKGEPTELLLDKTKRKIRFDKESTIPAKFDGYSSPT